MKAWIKAHQKAITGFLVGGVGMYLQQMDHGVTSDEWIQILVAAAIGGGLVGLIPNLPKKPPAV